MMETNKDIKKEYPPNIKAVLIFVIAVSTAALAYNLARPLLAQYSIYNADEIYKVSVWAILFFASVQVVSVYLFFKGSFLKTKKRFAKVFKRRPAASTFAVILLAVLLLAPLYSAVKSYKAYFYLAGAAEAFSQKQDLDASLNMASMAISAKPDNEKVLRLGTELLILKLREITSDKNISDKEFGKQFATTLQNAKQLATTATEIDKNNAQNWINLGRVYGEVAGLSDGADTKAIKAYQQARELDPFSSSLPLKQAEVAFITAERLERKAETLGKTGDSFRKRVFMEKSKESLELALKYVYEALFFEENPEALDLLDKIKSKN